MAVHILRYDDFSADSSSAVEEKLVDIFLRHRLSCTFAVIPFVCDSNTLLCAGEVKLSPLPRSKVALLRPLLEEGLGEVALHGYAHLALSTIRGCHEFSDLMPKETQRRLIQRGRCHLEDAFGLKIRLFVPPWNKLSASTALVLHEEEFLLSSDVCEPADSVDFSLPQMPCSASIAETVGALKAAVKIGKRWSSVGTLLHDYDFRESGHPASRLNFDEFDRIIRHWRRIPTIENQSISAAILNQSEPGLERLLANSYLRGKVSRSRLARRWLRVLGLVFGDDTRMAIKGLAKAMSYIP